MTHQAALTGEPWEGREGREGRGGEGRGGEGRGGEGREGVCEREEGCVCERERDTSIIVSERSMRTDVSTGS